MARLKFSDVSGDDEPPSSLSFFFRRDIFPGSVPKEVAADEAVVAAAVVATATTVVNRVCLSRRVFGLFVFCLIF